MKKLFIYIVFFSLLSCQKQSDWEIKTQSVDAIIVDGTISSENRIQSIHITHPITSLNEFPVPVTGATVLINDGDSVYQLNEQSLNPGFYLSNSKFLGVEGRQYTLIINYNNKIFTAKSFMLPSVTFHPLSYAKNENDELYHIDKVNTSFNASQYAMWEIFLDWSFLPAYQNQNPTDCKARLLYYTLPTLDVSEVLAPQQQHITFPIGTIITEKRYSLNPEHAAYFRALLSETTWTGGLFDSSHANLPTNLSIGALGFFAACGVSSLSITVVP